MIWYLLYPFRGTTEPPVLSDNHPIRRAFYRHGTLASKNWLLFLLSSVLISVTVLYAFFIGSPGFSKLPGHGWISARAHGSGQDHLEDVAVRRVWIHGDYMGALKPHVLREALAIQNALINDHFPFAQSGDSVQDQGEVTEDSCHTHAGVSDGPSWGFHSPMMYWNCSASILNTDRDLMSTIQEQSSRISYLNLTLLPASVLSGKHFSGEKLKEADALVITHFVKTPSRGATSWDARLVKLAAEYTDRWSFYPASGAMTTSQVYEYQRELISTRDFSLLAAAYIVMFLYIAYRMKETRVVRSRFGLFAAIFTEIAISVCASFTLCSLLEIDLTRIPQEMYPFVVLVIGLENMFRLMNAVFSQLPHIEPTKRIAKALGDIGHISLANATQHLGFLWIFSKFSNSTTQSFCIFAGFALLFDFLFHLVFFIAVLSVEVRRMELQDSIGREDLKTEGKKPRKKQSWLDALLSGRLPLSTRFAGSVVCIGFTLGINVHFTDSELLSRSILRYLLSSLSFASVDKGHDQYPFAPPPINQARTPQSWLKLQDHQFTKEVIEFIKPGANAMIARVYAPVIIVLRGSDRGQDLLSKGVFWQMMKTLNQHILPVLFFIFIFIGLITALMDYLLWDNRTDEERQDASDGEDYVMNFKRLPLAHNMDIFRLSASIKGHVAAVSLDRTISAYTFNSKAQAFLGDTTLAPKFDRLDLWPISQVVIDDTGLWIAICTSQGMVSVWNRSKGRWTEIPECDFHSQPPLLMEFRAIKIKNNTLCLLLLAFANGSHFIINIETNKIVLNTHVGLVDSAIFVETARGPHILSVGNDGTLFVVPLTPGLPPSTPNYKMAIRSTGARAEDPIRAVQFISPLNVLVAIRSRSIDLLDFATSLNVASVVLAERIVPGSLRVFHSHLRECRNCQSPAVHSFSIAYNSAGQKRFVLKTFTATNGEHPLICFHPTTNSDIATCQTLDQHEIEDKIVDNPGNWQVTSHQTVIGVRQRSSLDECTTRNKDITAVSNGQSTSSATYTPANTATRRSAVSSHSTSRRRSSETRGPDLTSLVTSPIEVWSLSPNTEFVTKTIPPLPDDLFVVTSGPIVPLGARSVAIAFGNNVRVVTIGSDRIVEDVPHTWTATTTNIHASGKARGKEAKKRKGGTIVRQ